MLPILEKNNVKLYGSGNETIVFVHGYGCDQNMWRFILPQFVDRFRVILLDLVGSGASDISHYDFEKYGSLKAHADDILDVCDQLALERITLIGHSVSAMIGAHLATQRPALVKNLIMVCPSPRYINDENYYGGFEEAQIHELVEMLESNYLGWSSMITPLIMGNPDRPDLAQELHDSFCRNEPEIAKHFARVTFLGDEREVLSKVAVRSLVIHCDPDVISPKVVSQYVQSSIKGSSIKLINATGHCPHMSAPDETANAIHEFLA